MSLNFDQSFILDLLNSICPHCSMKGVVYYNPLTSYFSCNNCKTLSVDPYAVGPWDVSARTVDTFNDSVVSSFIVSGEVESPKEPDKNYLDFWKMLYEKGEVTP